MASTLPTRCFISYSRTDSAFVDRLEADLRARGFETWVDRRRLEGAHDWEQEIFRGVDWCSLMIVVLSPDAARSDAVGREYHYALSKNKLVIPLLWRDCHMPSELEKIQWVDFHVVDHAAGLKTLLIAIADRADQRTSLPTDSRELYKQAIEARQRGDLERAAILLQRLVDHEPGYANGEATRDLATVIEQLYAERAQRLRQDAMDARRKGEYGREAGILEALVSLGPEDAWAEEYLPIAWRNRKQLELYETVQSYMDAGDMEEARAKLMRLWAEAPFFRDPADVARTLGLTIPPSYEEDKERKEASEWKQRAEAREDAELTRAVDEENQQWRSTLQLRKETSVGKIIARERALRTMDKEPAMTCFWILALLLSWGVAFLAERVLNVHTDFVLALIFFLGWLPLSWLLGALFLVIHMVRIARARRRSSQAERAFEQWAKPAEAEHQRRLQELKEAHQQRMMAVEAEYQRMIERITRKYAASR